MMRRIIGEKQMIFFLLLLILSGGVVSFLLLPKQEAPEIEAPYALMTTPYLGAAQSAVDRFVTEKIIEETRNTEGHLSTISFSSQGLSTVILQLDYGTDTDEAFASLTRRLGVLEGKLPEGAGPIMINTDVTETAGFLIALGGEEVPSEILGYHADRLVEALADVEGLARLETLGDTPAELVVRVDAKALHDQRVTLSDIAAQIDAQNTEIPTGTLEEAVPLVIPGSFDRVEALEQLVLDLSLETGTPLMLRDLAELNFEAQESNVTYRIDGTPAVLLSGAYAEGENILPIGRRVDAVIESFRPSLPEGVVLRTITSQSREVSDSVGGFFVSLLMGILFVIAVVFVGMGARNALVVSTAIPLSMLITFAFMLVFEIPIHQISIAAMIVALGMLVDNAIVVADSIQHQVDLRGNTIDAVAAGAREVLGPVLTSTLTTVAAFSPLLLLSSLAGDYVKALPQVVMLSLGASFFVAMVITPVLAHTFFRKSEKPSRFTAERLGLQRILSGALDHKKRAFILGIALLLLLGSSFFALDLIFFPKTDKTLLYVDITAEKKGDREATGALVAEIEEILAEEEGVEMMAAAVGGGLPKFYDTLGVYAPIPDQGQIAFAIDPEKNVYADNAERVEQLQQKVSRRLIGGEATVKALEYAEPSEAAINLRFYAENVEVLRSVVQEARTILSSIPGSLNVRTDDQGRTQQYEWLLDEGRLAYAGLTKAEVLNEISLAVQGRPVGTYRGGVEEHPIRIVSDAETLEAVRTLQIRSSLTGQKTPLAALGEVSLRAVEPTIKRYDGKRVMTLSSDVLTGYSRSAIRSELLTRLNQMDTSGVRYELDGEDEKIAKYFGNLGTSALFAIGAIYTILFFEFKSTRVPLLILLTVPLASAGSVFGLFLIDQPLSFTALLGIVSLIGIVVNNAIVLIDHIVYHRGEGLTVDAACREASSKRFRPILLSTTTTIIGLLPLALSESELFKPMATALIFGLAISTLLTLVFVPLVYSLVFSDETSESSVTGGSV